VYKNTTTKPVVGTENFSVVNPDPDTDPHPHQIKIQNPDTHQGDKTNPDPHQGDADPQHWRILTQSSPNGTIPECQEVFGWPDVLLALPGEPPLHQHLRHGQSRH